MCEEGTRSIAGESGSAPASLPAADESICSAGASTGGTYSSSYALFSAAGVSYGVYSY